MTDVQTISEMAQLGAGISMGFGAIGAGIYPTDTITESASTSVSVPSFDAITTPLSVISLIVPY